MARAIEPNNARESLIRARSSNGLDGQTRAAHTRVMKIPLAHDPLGEALHFLRMSGVFYCRSEFTAPWALDLPAFEDCLMFHVVTSGRCVLGCEGLRGSRPAAWRLCARAARCRPPAGERAWSSWREALRSASRTSERPVRNPAPRWGRRADDGHLRRGSIRSSGRRSAGDPAAQSDRRRRVELARGGVDPEHAAIDGDRSQRAASWRRDRDHAARRHSGHPGHPILDCERSSRSDGMARCASGQTDRPRHCPRPSRTRASMDGRVAGERGRDVPLGICRALYGAGWRASDALRRALAHACRLDVAERRRCTGQRDGESSRIRVGGRVQPGVQAISRVPSGGRSTGEVRSIDRKHRYVHG